MIKISVIVPVYKAEKYLDRCIESILAQTFTDFELILIDDGSPDDCPAMCDEWAKKDRRIKVLHQKNQGQAVARNNALDIAQGEYFAFVDSDDYIHPQMFEILMSNMDSANAKISVGCYINATDDNGFANNSNIKNEEYSTWNGKNFLKHCIIDRIEKKSWVLWDKIFHRSCFDNVRMPVGRINEDNAVVYKILYETDVVVDCDIPLYAYYLNPESTVNKAFSKKNLDWLLVLEEMICFFKEKDDELLYNKICKSYLYALAELYQKVKKNLDEPEILRELKKKLKQQYRSEKVKYPITIETHPWVYDILFPFYSILYYIFKG